MTTIKRFEDFMKESTENKGKGIGGDTDLFSKPSPKQTVNKGDLNPIDNLGIRGRQITTDKIDGIVKNVTGGDVYVEDRLTKEIKIYSIPEFLKEFNKAYNKEKKTEKTNESIIIEEVKQPELKEEDKEILNKILGVNESSSSHEKELWEKKWESFASNYIKATKEIEDDDVDDEHINENRIISTPEEYDNFIREFENEIDGRCLSSGAKCMNDKIDIINDIEEREGIEVDTTGWEDLYDEIIDRTWDGEWSVSENTQNEKSNINVKKFSEFINNRIKIRPEDSLEIEDDEIVENSVPEPPKQISCSDCGDKVYDIDTDKVRHLYSKHNFKPSVDNLDKWLLQYFPPETEED